MAKADKPEGAPAKAAATKPAGGASRALRARRQGRPRGREGGARSGGQGARHGGDPPAAARALSGGHRARPHAGAGVPESAPGAAAREDRPQHGARRGQGEREGAGRGRRRIPQRDIALAYNNRGATLADKGDHDGAIADYKTAFKLNPPDAVAYINRGIAYGKNGDHDRAIADFDKAIKLNPKQANAYYNRGIAYRDLGDLDRALTNFDKAIKLNPTDANAYYNRGITYERKGEYGRAIADYKSASQEFPRRSPSVENCRVTLGLLVPSASPRPELPTSVNSNWSDRTVCILALDAQKQVTGASTRVDVQEFSRRGLTVESCRAILGLSSINVSPKPGPSSSANINWSDRTVCILALDAEKLSVGASTGPGAHEFSRRNLSVEKCRRTLGLSTTTSVSPKPQPSSSPPTHRSELTRCILALHVEQLNVGTSWRPEVQEFSLETDLPLAARIAEEERRKAEATRIAEEELKKAEAARIAEEKRQRAQAARLAEEQRRRAEAARIAEEERRKAEAARIAEEERRKAEVARIAEEERKKAEAVRIAEEERRKAEVAQKRQKAEAVRLASAEEERKEAAASETSQTGAAKVAQQERAKVKIAEPSGCGSVALEITGYKNNRAELPKGAAGQLAAVAKSLKGTRCRVRITGHASNKEQKRVRTTLFHGRHDPVDKAVVSFGIPADQIEPSIDRMSRARAAAVARELRRLGVAADQISTSAAIGGGQRVIVTVQ